MGLPVSAGRQLGGAQTVLIAYQPIRIGGSLQALLPDSLQVSGLVKLGGVAWILTPARS